VTTRSKDDIEAIARAGAVVADTLALLRDAARPGVTTGELDALAEETIRTAGGAPTFLGHQGFTRSICASPNAVVVHGIPNGYTLVEGDVIALDVGVTLDGWIADSAVTVPVGPVAEDDVHLLETCRLALVDALRACRPGNHVGDIGAAVQRRVEAEGFSIVPALGGHGVGRQLWEDPVVPNHGLAGRGPRLVEGLVLAIEPIIVAGRPDTVLHDDGWTISTRDGARAAHFEHTVAVGPDGPRVLTRAGGGSPVDEPLARAA
jgi:methionyl aminopeptidase